MPTPNGIKAIFFDLDGTLRHSVPSGGDIFNDYIRTLEIPFSEEDRLRAMRWEMLVLGEFARPARRSENPRRRE